MKSACNFTLPDQPIVLIFQILTTDIDGNKHANYKTYISRCHDALLHAITIKEMNQPASAELTPEKHCQEVDLNKQVTNEGNDSASENDNHKQVLPRWLTSKILRQGVKTLRSKFIKEMNAGEEANIYVWQEQGKPFWAFFSVEQRKPPSSQIVFELSMEFFGPSSNL